MYVRANAPNWHEADLEDVLGEGDDAGVGILGEEGWRALRLHGPSIPVVPAGLGGAGLADGVLDLDKVAPQNATLRSKGWASGAHAGKAYYTTRRIRTKGDVGLEWSPPSRSPRVATRASGHPGGGRT